MSQPKTLFEMAGVRITPPPLDKLTVVLIDMQMEYLSGKLPLPNARQAVAEAASLVASAREAGRPVIHVQHKGQPGGLFDPGSAGFSIAPELEPRGAERIINKGLPNSFAGTELEALLKEMGATHLAFAGFMTHMCVSSTVRAALDRGFSSVVVAKACGTRDLPDGSGGVVSADILHRTELAALADRFALIVDGAKELARG